MPKTADPAIAEALVEVGARLIAAHEPLSTRRLAAEVGMSTSAVYTHFGSMDELRRAVRRVGFERLAEYQRSFTESDDPVADLGKQGLAYCRNAIENPNMYRVMFMEQPIDETDAEVGRYTFDILVAGVQRCIDAGRFDDGDAEDMATHFWVATHGAISLYLAGMLEEGDAVSLMSRMAYALCLQFGDSRDRLDASFTQAGEWMRRRVQAEPSN